MWRHDGHAHIEVRGASQGLVTDEHARLLEHAVAKVDGVHWVAFNGVLGRIVVSYDETKANLADLVAVIGEAERRNLPLDQIVGIADLDATLGDAIALTGDVTGTAAGLVGRALRLPRVPSELAAVTAMFEHLPPLRSFLRRTLGPTRADLGVALTASTIGATAQATLGTLADMALRLARLSEASAHRDVLARRVNELHRDAASSRASTPRLLQRPAGLPDGPIERYATRISVVSLLTAGVMLPLRNGRSRAARTIAAGSPRAATLGGEAYTSQLGSMLARRGVVVRDRSALRRLDRVDTVIVDSAILGGDPLALAVAGSARKLGRLLIAGRAGTLDRRISADGRVAGGSRLAASVRAEQRKGHAVVLLATRNDAALTAADCGIGILSGDRRPPWGAHLLCGPDLEPAWLVLEAATLARRVSSRSTRVALLGSVTGGLLGLADNRPEGARRALLAGGVASLASMAAAAWSVRNLGRRPGPIPEDLTPWHALPVADALRALESVPIGLTNEQAAKRRAETLQDRAGELKHGLVSQTLAELDTPLTGPLLAGASLSAASGSPVDAGLVLAVVASNALLSAGQKVTTDRTLRHLLGAGGLRARLVRAEGQRLCPVEDLVRGDIIRLEPGDAVPADCRLVEAVNLEIDESTLTGESMPVLKSTTPTLAVSVAERSSMVFAGTTVAAGTGAAVVVATARYTVAARSADAALAEEAPATGVQARLNRITSASIPAAAAAAATVLGNGLARGRAAEAISSSVALAVAAIPEGLPFVATVAQLSASRRLSRRNILIREPRAMEALGRTNVICFDKTGTLTEGRIRLHTISNGRSRQPLARLDRDHRDILAAAVRASPVPEGAQVLPHPTDQAIVAGAEEAGVTADEGWRLVRELPFEPGRGFHAVLGTAASGHLISVKGAPEVVLPRCGSWRRGGEARRLRAQDRREIEAEVDRMARQGLRVLAVAQRLTSGRQRLDEEHIERLELLGLLGLADPTRATAAEAVRRLRHSGVKVIMLTGDHPSTAEAIGAELDLLNGEAVVIGPDVDEADDATMDALVAKSAVFARVSPSHKVAVVRALRRAGHVVAVTGDGANDAPAIRLADVGIALGDKATTAAREAADMIVIDGRIETIADGVIEGRAMWASVRDAVALLVGGNLGEVVFTALSAVVSPGAALNARQLLFINLMTDLLPALTVAARPPRSVTPESLAREGPESSLGAALTREIGRRAATTGLTATGAWLAARLTGTSRRASTVALAALVAAQLAQTALASHGDAVVLAATGISLAMLVAAVQTPGISRFFGSRPLGPLAWGIVACAVLAAMAGAAINLPQGRDEATPDEPIA